MAGKACIRGMRVTVVAVVGLVAAGELYGIATARLGTRYIADSTRPRR